MKKSTLRDSIKAEIIEILSEETAEDIQDKTSAQAELNKELEKTQDLMKEDEEEPSSKDLKAGKKDSISKISNKLQQTTKEMKSVVKKWKNADGLCVLCKKCHFCPGMYIYIFWNIFIL